MTSLTITQHWSPETQALTFTVDGWPSVIEIAPELLEHARPDLLQVDGDTLTFTLANGSAVYRLARDEGDIVSVPAYLISSRLTSTEWEAAP